MKIAFQNKQDLQETERSTSFSSDALDEWSRIREQLEEAEEMKMSDQGLSASEEYLSAKKDFQTTMDMKAYIIHALSKGHDVTQEMKESLMQALSKVNDLRIKRGRRLRELSENLSPLLSLQNIDGVFDNVMGCLDEEALYCLEEAAGCSIRGSRAARNQWSKLHERNNRRYRYYKRASGRYQVFADGRAFGKYTFCANRNAAIATKMEASVSKDFDFDRPWYAGNSTDHSLFAVDGHEEYQFSSLLDTRYIWRRHDPDSVMVRLSLRLPTDERGSGHLIWRGNTSYDVWQGDTSYYIHIPMDDKVRHMNWPELEEIHRWVDKVCPLCPVKSKYGSYTAPWERDGYEDKIRNLIEDVRVAIVYDGQLFVATGGYDRYEHMKHGWIDFTTMYSFVDRAAHGVVRKLRCRVRIGIRDPDDPSFELRLDEDQQVWNDEDLSMLPFLWRS